MFHRNTLNNENKNVDKNKIHENDEFRLEVHITNIKIL